MKFIYSFLTLLFASCAASNSLSFFGADQHVLDDDVSVPGDNPLEFCQKDNEYTLTINKVDLTPNPPKPYVKTHFDPLFTKWQSLTLFNSGKTLTIEAKGNFTEEVKEGAYIDLSVKYGLIRLINQRTDLCEQMKNVDEECPLNGEKTITKDVDLLKEIPPVRSPVDISLSHTHMPPCFSNMFLTTRGSIPCLPTCIPRTTSR